MAPKAAVVEMPTAPPPETVAYNVYQKIAAVSGELAKNGIGKGRKNEQQHYTFRGIDDVYNALAPLLAKYGLIVLPRMLSRVVTERTTTKGGVLFYVTLEAEFDFVSADDGTKHTVRTFGEAMDSGDKATNKAMSAAYKYAAVMTFCIPTEGDNDTENQTHDVAAPVDELGYAEWLNNLSLSARPGELGELITTIKCGPSAFQDKLRGDKASWSRLKALTEAK